jgi:pimeloyl-ACP methyl ester carboxylesterase
VFVSLLFFTHHFGTDRPRKEREMQASKETVVLVHGLWFSAWSMRLLQWRLQRAGFDVRLYAYRSVTHDLRQQATALQRFLRGVDGDEIHFVGHSLGGVIIRALFHFYPEQRPGRIVTLGSPHAGSAIAARLARRRPLRQLLGRSIADLVNGDPNAWSFPVREVGAVAGSVSVGLGRLFGPLPAPNDGTVTVEEACWSQASDQVVLRASHFGMLFMPGVARQTACFLRSGRFCR